MTRQSYPIHRTRGLGSPNTISAGAFDYDDQSSIAEMSVDFSVYSDGISSLAAESVISGSINNISNHAIAPVRSPANSNTYGYDPYASVVDSDSGASPSLHMGSLGDAPDPPLTNGNKASGGVEMMKRLSARFADIRPTKDRPLQEEFPSDNDRHSKSTIKTEKGHCMVFPAWLSDAPPAFRFVLLLSAALFVGAGAMLIIIAIGAAAEKRSNSSQDFAPMGGQVLGVIPSMSQETMKPSLEPTLEPTVEPTFEAPPAFFDQPTGADGVTLLPSIPLEAQSHMPSHLPTTQLDASCRDSSEPVSYVLESGIVQTIETCDILLTDFRLFVLNNLCGLAIVGIPSADTTLVSDRCPRTCNTCDATKIPSSAPSQAIDLPTPIPSSIPSTGGPTAKSIRPTSTKSIFFVTSGHFKRSNDVGTLLRALPSDDGAFLLHLGDMNRPQWRDCDKKSWQIILEMWLESSIPLFAVPGEDDWTHCDDPDDGWELWEDYLLGVDRCCWDDYMYDSGAVSRQEGTTENWAFVRNRVLYIGLHLVSGPDIPNNKEWKNRLNANVEWLLHAAATSGESVEVTCVFGHSNANDEANRDFFESFAAAADMWNIPVLYFHQDDETEYPWTYERNLFGVRNFLRVGVREKLWPPLRVEIDTATNKFNLDDSMWHVGLVDNGGGIFDGKLQAIGDGQ